MGMLRNFYYTFILYIAALNQANLSSEYSLFCLQLFLIALTAVFMVAATYFFARIY
jgi:hypothetical protein